MASPIEALQAAGFNEDAINAWSVARRDELTSAGFKENEIDAYFAGSVTVPEKVPEPFERRVEQGAEARKREGGLMQTIPQGIEFMSTPEGRRKLWEGLKQFPQHAVEGLLGLGGLPQKAVKGELDLSTDEGLDDAIGLGTLIATGRLSKLPTTGRTSGMGVTFGGEVSRIDRTPTGEIVDTPIGGLPKAEDFANAAKTVAEGDARMPVQEKLMRLWEEQGRHPAEVAADAERDPIIRQQLLSKDPSFKVYHGSPHQFDFFDYSKIGSGEGAQAFGYGLYVAENVKIAEFYQRSTAKGGEGNLYQIRVLGDKDRFLHWDKPLADQPPEIAGPVQRWGEKYLGGDLSKADGEAVYHGVADVIGPVAASAELRALGVPGIKFYDALSRSQGMTISTELLPGDNKFHVVGPGKKFYGTFGSREAAEAYIKENADNGRTHNFVLFSDDLLEISHKNGTPITALERNELLKSMEGGASSALPRNPDVDIMTEPVVDIPFDTQGKLPDNVKMGAQSGRLIAVDESGKLPLGRQEFILKPPETAPERVKGMTPAIRFDDQIFTGASHLEAFDKARAAFGEDLRGAAGKRADYGGFVPRDKPTEYLTFKEAVAREQAAAAEAFPAKEISYAGELRDALADANGGKPPADVPPGGKPPAPPPGSPEEAQAKVLSKISVGERDRRPMNFRRLYREAIDDLHPIKAITSEGYELARLTRGSFGRAEFFLERSTFDFDTLKNNGRSFADIIKPVREDMDGLRAYLAAKRATELEASGRKSGMDVEAIAKVIETGRVKYQGIAKEIVDYQTRLLEYLRDSGVVSDKAFGAMLEANQNYIPFYRLVGGEAGGPKGGSSLGPGSPIKRLKGSERDIIDPLESIIKNTYAYVSIAERNAAGVKIIEALKERGVEVKTAKEAAVGKTDSELVDYLKAQGITEPEQLVDFINNAGPSTGDKISALRDGKRIEAYIKDPDLVQAFNGLDRQGVDLLTRVLAAPARALRAGATLSPDFMARNLIRDFLQAFVTSKGAVFSPIDTAKGVSSLLRRDANYEAWVKGGGANSTFVALDRAYLQESLNKLDAETGLMKRGWNVITSPLRGLRAISETIENATRIGEFRKLAGPEATKAEIQSAAFTSREVTIDFARMGARMRAYNMITAFANAQIQGIDRTARAFIDRPINTTAKVAAGVTLPSILLWWANRDDQRYKELPDWQKDLFWIVLTDKWEPISLVDAQSKPDHLIRQQGGRTEFNNGSIYRIPKPHELGVVFGSGVERALEQFVGNNPEAFANFSKSVQQVLGPNFMPTAAQPMFEQWANRSSFTDRTLIPADMEKHLPEYQYTPYTTELSKKLGQMISAIPGVRTAATEPGSPGGPLARAATSPILIENYVRAWSGGLGMYVLEASDYALRKQGKLPDPVKPTPTLADIPFVKAFAVRYPSASAQPIQDFYDDHERNKRFFDTWMARAQEGDAVAMQRIQDAGGPGMFLRLDAFKETLSEHGKLVRDIYKNPQIPADEKRQLIDSLYFNMIQIAKTGRDVMREMKVAP